MSAIIPAPGVSLTCAAGSCLYRTAAGRSLVLIEDAGALPAACAGADAAVSLAAADAPRCPARWFLDALTLRRQGGVMARIGPDGLVQAEPLTPPPTGRPWEGNPQ